MNDNKVVEIFPGETGNRLVPPPNVHYLDPATVLDQLQLIESIVATEEIQAVAIVIIPARSTPVNGFVTASTQGGMELLSQLTRLQYRVNKDIDAILEDAQ